MKRTLRTLFLALLLPATSFAQESFDKAKLDQYFDALNQHNQFMGSVALAKNGTVIYEKAIGFTDVASQHKADVTSTYRIGSISKTFTSVLIFKAIEAKKLSLDTKLQKFFPSVKNADKITISQLLQHRSGVHSFTSNEDYNTWSSKAHTEKELVDIIVKGGSDFEPDSKADYSNSAYVLLTYILEKVNKKPYGTLLKEQITEPLGLKHTYLGQGIKPENNEALSYSSKNGWKLEPETHPSVPLGAGAIVSNPSDLLKFGHALFTGKLLSANSLQQMEELKDGYGRGLFPLGFDDKKAFGHNGGIDGFRSTWGFFPSQEVGLAVTSNGASLDVNEVAITLLSAIFNKDYSIPEFSTIKVEEADLVPYLGGYSSAQIPLKITITKEGNKLFAQATGQPSFPLDPVKKDVFEFKTAKIVIEFNSSDNSFILKQGGQEYAYKKD